MATYAFHSSELDILNITLLRRQKRTRNYFEHFGKTLVETFVYLFLAGSTNTVSCRKLKKKNILYYNSAIDYSMSISNFSILPCLICTLQIVSS